MNTLILLTIIVCTLAFGFYLARKIEDMAHPLQGLMPPLLLAILLVVACISGVSLITIGACTFVTSFCVATWAIFDGEERATKRLRNHASPFNLDSGNAMKVTEADNPFTRRQPDSAPKKPKGWVGPGIRQAPGGAIIKLECQNRLPRKRRQGPSVDGNPVKLVRVK